MMSGRLGRLLISFVASCVCSIAVHAQTLPSDFAKPPGDLEPGSGTGRKDPTVYFPNMRFPIEEGPAFANSQVYRPGGMHGGGGDQCDKTNYAYPWRDIYCEIRQWDMPLCPGSKGHQGQDIRPATCKKDTYWTVAVADGVISHVGTYSVTLQTPNGVLFRYLHVNMSQLAVGRLDTVKAGDRIGMVSNWFGDDKTTIHLHFDIRGPITVNNKTFTAYLPPYTSLVESYKVLMK
ncbi:murein DD-endopeptidase MepM/ murein hydrolase activator NlpD [Bradyrhizobium huanghuaihaiense]